MKSKTIKVNLIAAVVVEVLVAAVVVVGTILTAKDIDDAL